MKRVAGKILATVLFGALLSSLALLALRATVGWPDDATCSYVLQLAADPALRAELADEIGRLRSDACAVFGFGAESQPLDRLSHNCLACHDGSGARTFDLKIRTGPGEAPLSLSTIIGGHPVGMFYGRYADSGYRCDSDFPTAMVFAAGRVGCFTCHDPFNGAPGHLVVDNVGSVLCFVCHNK